MSIWGQKRDTTIHGDGNIKQIRLRLYEYALALQSDCKDIDEPVKKTLEHVTGTNKIYIKQLFEKNISMDGNQNQVSRSICVHIKK